MKFVLFVLVSLITFSFAVEEKKINRVERALQLVQQGGVYRQGCSEFVAKVLGIRWEDANSMMGNNPQFIGNNGNYRASPGDVIGWKANGSGHVAIYIGRANCKVADVRNPGATPRCLSSYGGQNVFKSSKY